MTLRRATTLATAMDVGNPSNMERIFELCGGLDAARIWTVSSLGKYIPGAVWSMGAHAQLARRHQVPVRTGRFGAERVPVTAGLSPDDWVVVAGGHLLREGQDVRAVDRDNRVVGASGQ